ncbi:uncharacterized protein BXZ73DRAFT_81656 [Epithele typhae]|uniref:uncharacterized protein n=1 Tax=Epithele typhae TaxID=378194 RepID=UPI0020076E5F|nr:uncharacterized protein BXZ73DRAFT_81656 [Epithele typhae]KAH9914517.1 hypothetical protein BXZ73DRAFT_81656 [Epithele typhae]
MLSLVTLALGLAATVSAVPLGPGNTTLHHARAASTLFPVDQGSKSWTVSKGQSGALPLSDDTFRPFNEIKDLTHDYVSAPDGVLSMEAVYPKGSFKPSASPRGGITFYAPGPASVDLTTAKEATLSYTVLFEEGFDFNKGGKLPGLCGRRQQRQGGGRVLGRPARHRLLLRAVHVAAGGAGELYTYLPPGIDANTKVCSVPPQSECNDVFGQSVGRGAFSFTPGTRATIGQRVRLNDVGQENGELELFVTGRAYAGRIRGIQMQTFFGGSDSSWASPKEQHVYFSDFSVAITEAL